MKKIKKMPLLISIIILVVLFIYFSMPRDIEFNEDYINSDILTLSDDSVEKILLKKEINEFTLAVCATGNDNIMLLFLDDEFNLLFSLSYPADTLTDDMYNVYEEAMPKIEDGLVFDTTIMSSDQKLYYNIFLNPTKDSITINNHDLDVHELNYQFNNKEYRIGFWYYVE